MIDPELETSDPTPDILQLFHKFNVQFFRGFFSRKHVKVEWNTRMFISAGRCSSKHFCGLDLVTIELSAKLLKYRPRKDLIETLLVSVKLR